MGVVLPAKGDVLVIHRQQSVIRDGHAMRVAGQILKHMLRPPKGRLGVHDPLLPEESVQESGKRLFVCQRLTVPVERKLVSLKCLL